MKVRACLLMVALMGCGGGGAAGPDAGAAGRGGAPQGTGGVAGAGGSAGGGGIAGIGAGTGGTAGAGGAPGTGGAGGTAGAVGTGGAAGAGGVAGAAGSAQAAGGVGGMNCRPDVLIVQDKSGSMNNDDNDLSCAGGGCGITSKWSQVSTAITNVVMTTDATVNWGIKYFPDNNACDASAPPVVPIAAMTGTLVASSFAATAPGGNTPTRDAITTAAAYLQTLADTNPKFLLLVTDGLPNCPVGCASMSKPSNLCTQTDNPTEDAAAEMAVANAVAQGFNTFVVGIGNVASAQNTLDQLALAGGEAQTGGATSYYPATNEAALETALNSIVDKIAGCSHP